MQVEVVNAKNSISNAILGLTNPNTGLPIANASAKRPVAFVHPHDDATLRSLQVAGESHDLVFGTSWVLSQTSAVRVYGLASGAKDGTLYRVAIDKDTTAAHFTNNLKPNLNTSTPFSVQPYAYPSSYRAKDGTVVVDGTGGNDSIVLGSGLSGYNSPVYAPAVGAARFDAQTYGGNDNVSVGTALPARIDGGSGNDTLAGGSANDVLYGYGGADKLYGNGGADRLYGGGGNDSLYGGAGSDTMYGEDGDDFFGATNDGVYDYLRGGPGSDVLEGNLKDAADNVVL